MSTGDQYAHTHSMGIAMPGMGAAIPMPGLAKAGMRIPGMAVDPSQASDEPEAPADVAHVRCHGDCCLEADKSDRLTMSLTLVCVTLLLVCRRQ